MTKETFKIEFFTDEKALAVTPELHPQPMKAFTPSWWKDMPANPIPSDKYLKSVKACPSFPDFFSLGYVLPMWMDTTLQYDYKTKQHSFNHGQNIYSMMKFKNDPIHLHLNEQFLSHVPNPNFLGNSSNFVFKFISPWYARTEPGVSLLQLPMFYNFNGDFSVMPGVIDTDIHHVLNQQVVYHGNGEEIYIKRGTPIVQYIPFRRANYEATTQLINAEFEEKLDISLYRIASMFDGAYRDAQRKRDKKSET